MGYDVGDAGDNYESGVESDVGSDDISDAKCDVESGPKDDVRSEAEVRNSQKKNPKAKTKPTGREVTKGIYDKYQNQHRKN